MPKCASKVFTFLIYLKQHCYMVQPSSFRRDCEMTLQLLVRPSTARCRHSPLNHFLLWIRLWCVRLLNEVLLSRSVYTLPLPILEYIKNCILERTACLHTSLLQKEKCYENFLQIESRFWSVQNGTNACSWLGFQVQTRCDLCWTCRRFGTPTDEQNRWNCERNAGTCPRKQKNHNPWSCWHVGNLIWVKLPPGVNPTAVNRHIMSYIKSRVFQDNVNMRQIVAKFVPHVEWGTGETRQHVPGPLRKAWKRCSIPFEQNHSW